MKTIKLFPPALALLLFAQSAWAGKEIDRLLNEYSKIETVTCQVRRIKEGELGKMKFLSRVYYTNKDQIHAEGLTPLRRRTIADGKTLYQYVEGDPKGFSRPIPDLSEEMTISLKLVPGTAMEHLLRLKGREETELTPAEGAAKRIGLQAENQYVVISLDADDRPVGIDFYQTAAMKSKTAAYQYSGFVEAAPGTWVPLTHASQVYGREAAMKETVKFDRFAANKPIAASLFIPGNFFDSDIDFVDDFAKIYPE